MESFGFDNSEKTFDWIIKHYSEKHRAYHNTIHVMDCLNNLDKLPSETTNLKEIEMNQSEIPHLSLPILYYVKKIPSFHPPFFFSQ